MSGSGASYSAIVPPTQTATKRKQRASVPAIESWRGRDSPDANPAQESQNTDRPREMRGDCPPCNTQVIWMSTKYGVNYVYGGILPDDKAYMPTNNFYAMCPEADTLIWSHLNQQLVRRYPDDPFNPLDGKKEPLPSITLPAGGMIPTPGDREFIFLFGGYDLDTSEPTSRFIFMVVARYAWWTVIPEGPPLRPRINAAVAVLKDKIYIFGSYERFDEDGEGCKPCYHYSVLRLHTQTTPFRWAVEANEVPYSAPLPAKFVVGEALPYSKITRSSFCQAVRRAKLPLMLDETAFWRFKVSSNKFVPCNLEGDFPGQVSGLQTSVTGAASSSVLLATFVAVDDEDPDQVAYRTELYEVNLLAEMITSHNIREKVLRSAPKTDVYHCTFFGGQAVFIGKSAVAASRPRKQQKRAAYDNYTGDKRLDVCLKIDIGRV